MTSRFDHPLEGHRAQSGRVACAAARLSSAILCVVGASLWLAAAWLWLTPGVLEDAATALMRLVTSVFFLLLGGVFLQAGRDPGRDEFQFDDAQHEIRHFLRGADGIARIQARYQFANLSEVRVDDGMFLARDRSGRIVLNRPARDLDAAHIVDVATQNGLIRKG